MAPASGPSAKLYFEDLHAGLCLSAGPCGVTRDEIVGFARQFDPVPRHLDEEAAGRSILDGLSASSAHVFSLYILLTTRLEPSLHSLAGLGWDELRLPSPTRPGDVLTLESEVVETRASQSKPDRGVVRFGLRMVNQRREAVLEGISTIMIARRGEPGAREPV